MKLSSLQRNVMLFVISVLSIKKFESIDKSATFLIKQSDSPDFFKCGSQHSLLVYPNTASKVFYLLHIYCCSAWSIFFNNLLLPKKYRQLAAYLNIFPTNSNSLVAVEKQYFQIRQNKAVRITEKFDNWKVFIKLSKKEDPWRDSMNKQKF